MQLASVVGTPGGVGGGTLGLGIVLSLHDQFSKQAVRVDRQMKMLGNRSDQLVARMDQGLHAMSAGLGTMAVGAGALTALAFPLRDAINFEEAIQNTFSIMDNQTPKAKKNLEDLSLRLGAMFPEDATEMSAVLKNILAAGIDDLNSAGYIAEVSTKLALPTDSNVSDVTNGVLSMLQAYGYTDKSLYSDEMIEEKVKRTGDQLFAASKIARFSDTSVSDMAAYSKQIGQIAPIAKQMGIEMDELLALSAVGTLGGQNARRMTTGLRQSFMDLMGGERGRNRLQPFLEFADQMGAEIVNSETNKVDFSGYINANSFTDLLGIVRKYAMIPGTNTKQLNNRLNSGLVQEQLKGLEQRIASGEIGKDTMISQDAGANELAETLAGLGVLDINKVREIFPSVWGLVAALPLLGSEFGKLQGSLEKIRDSAGSVDYAFAEIMKTVKMQWALLTSQVSTLNIAWGTHLLPAVSSTLFILNRMLDATIALSDHLGWLIQPLLTAAAYMGIFLASMGAAMAAAGGLQALNAFIATNAAEAGVFSRFLGGSLSAALWRVTWITLGLVAAQKILSYTWTTNLFGIRDIAENWYDRISAIFKGVSEIFKNLDWASGMSKISMSTRNNLKRLGVLEFTYKLVAVLVRLRMFIRGFTLGFNETMNAFRITLSEMFKGVADGMKALGILPRVQAWLESLFKPTRANVIAFKDFGETLGRIGAGLAVVAGVVASLTIFSVVSKMAWVLNGGFLGLLGTLAPLAIVVGAVGATGWLLRKAFDTNWNGFADKLTARFPQLAFTLGHFGEVVRNFVSILKTEGFGEAMKFLSLSLTGMLPSTIAEGIKDRLTNLGEAIRYFPRNLRLDGWANASLMALTTMFGQEQGLVVYNNIRKLQQGINSRFTAVTNLISSLPTLIKTLGWRQAFASVFQTMLPDNLKTALANMRQVAVMGFANLAAQFFMWLGRMGWSGYWITAQNVFTDVVNQMKGAWSGLRDLAVRVWTDLTTKVDWNKFLGGVVVAFSVMVQFITFAFNQAVAAASTFYDAFVGAIDWEQLKGLVKDISALISVPDAGAGGEKAASGWSGFWNTAADAVNIVVGSLRTVVKLMDAVKNFGTPEFGPKMGEAWENEKGVFSQIAANPIAGIGSFLLLDFIVTKLIGTVRSGAKVFGLMGTVLTKLVPIVWRAAGAMLGLIIGSPIAWVILAIAAIGLLVYAWKTDFMGLRTWLTNWWSGLSVQTQNILKVIGGVAATIAAVFILAVAWLPLLVAAIALGGAAFVSNFMGIRDKVYGVWLALIAWLGNTYNAVVKWLAGRLEAFNTTTKGIADRIGNAFTSIIDNIQSRWNNMLKSVITGFNDMIIQMNRVPGVNIPLISGPGVYNLDTQYEMFIPRGGAQWFNDPSVDVAGQTIKNDKIISSALQPVFSAVRAENSDGGKKITPAEENELTLVIGELVRQLQAGLTATTPAIYLDGRRLNRNAENYARQQGQVGSAKGGK